MAGKKITIEFLGKDSSSATARAVEKQFGKTGKALDRVGQRAGKLLAVGFLAAGVAAVKMGKAAAEDEAAASKLAQTLKTAAGATRGQVAATEDWITAQGKSLGISDDELRPALGRLAVATKDVGKAQKLASLAMDISAGSGKDLSVISMALAKAQNGNVAGLGRLGIATKDVHGKTLSLDQITKNLAATYKGAAAKAADTTAGKQRKLSVAFGELQEEIGTKLLPVMQKLTNVGLKMVDWIDHNKTTTLVLVGALGTLAAGLYAASVAMRFMTTVTSFQEAAAKRAAAGQTGLATSTLAIRGGALLAAGGLAILATKAGGAGTAMGGLATVGAGVAAGFAVGGPWGAAIGGAGGLLSVFAHHGDAAAASQAHMRAAVSTVTATLNEQTGAITANTRTTVAKTLADTGAFDAARKVGVSYKDVLNAALGNEAATKRVDAATRAYTLSQGNAHGASDSLRKGSRSLTGAMGENEAKVRAAKKTTDTLTGAVHGTTGAIADERKKIDQVNSAMGKGKDRTVTYTVRTPGLTGALGGLAALGRSIQAAIDKQAKLKAAGENAGGTDNWRGGLTWVGEKGPELINLQKGAQVIPNHKTQQYMASQGSSTRSIADSAGAGGAGSQRPLIVQMVLDGKVVAQSLVKFQNDTGRPIGLR